MTVDFENAVSPRSEFESYETLCAAPSVTLRRIAQLYVEQPALPSSLLQRARQRIMFDLEKLQSDVQRFLGTVVDKLKFSFGINGTFGYPKRLREAKYPLEVFYYRGDLGLLDSPCVSVVGARKCSKEGAKRAAWLSWGLAEAG